MFAGVFTVVKEPLGVTKPPSTMQPFNLVVFCLFKVFLGGQTLVLKQLDVPRTASPGTSQTLRCVLDLDGSKLKYIKWYKDGEEFCSFAAYKTPNLYQREIDGLSVKDVNCRNTTVKLNKVTVQSSGLYTCEASTVLQNVMSSKNMTVIVYPKRGPEITGLASDYKNGEFIQANCSAPPSYPPPTLSWFINGHLADGFLVHEYTEVVGPSGLYRRILSLKILAQEELFLGPEKAIIFVCVVSLPGFPSLRTIIATRMANPSSPLPIRIENEEITTQLLTNTLCNNNGNTIGLTWKLIGLLLWRCFEIIAHRLKATL